MTDLERRNRLADHETSVDGYGECFIAVHMEDGTVRTISGMASRVELQADTEDRLSWYGEVTRIETTGWCVTVNFLGDIVEEMMPMGKEVGA